MSMSHLSHARRLIQGAIDNPDAAVELLGKAADHITAALESVTGLPVHVARKVTEEAEGLFALMQCFEEGA
jgi:hypothetical protein